jgi:hypothetical protein
MGLFAHRGQNQGRAFKVWRAQAQKEKLLAFADLLADEVHPEDAAVRLGHTRPYGRVLLQKLRERLGWQAQ